MKRPEVLGSRNLTIALLLHIVAFVGFYLFAALHGLFKPKETIDPIELEVVVNENLDGEENEPPPLQNPEPEPPKPKPEPPKPKPVPKKIEPPKPLEQIVTNVVVKKEEQKKKEPPKKEEPKKEEPKKEEPKKPEPPKKTAKELREEKLKRIREKAKYSNKPVKIEVKNQPSGNGRTAKKTLSDAEIQKLLNQGYRAGTKEQLATSDMQLGVSRIQMALEDKWNQLSPKVGNSGYVLLSVRLNSNGGMVNVRISQSCGDKLSDAAALSVAQRVTAIPNLPPEFLSKFRQETLTIRYRVQGK